MNDARKWRIRRSVASEQGRPTVTVQWLDSIHLGSASRAILLLPEESYDFAG